jgi:perosamine synthetase
MIPVCEPVLDGNEQRYVQDCLRTNWISSMGKYITAFEEQFAAYCGARHGIACSSGTAAIHLAFAALGIGRGDEVIIPSFTLIVSANMVILSGAKPVLVDVDRRSWCIDPARIEEKITDRTKAIMPVHMYGHPCDMDRIGEIAQRHRLSVVEDAAEAHGAEYRGRKLGAIGDAGCFSFYSNKNLTTGEGGMVVTNDDRLAAKCRLLRNQGFEEPRFVHQVVGFNYRMTNIQAAIGVAQCERIEQKVERKREIGRIYTNLLEAESDIMLPHEEPWAKNVYWMYGIVVRDEFGKSKDLVMKELREKGVETRSFFCPMHLQPVFRGADPRYPDISGAYPVSEDLWRRGLYLPSGLGITKEQQEEVVAKLLSCRGRKT